MDYLIIIAIAAIALMLTGLTDFRALRRPFRPKADRLEESSDQPHRQGGPRAASRASERHADGRRNS